MWLPDYDLKIYWGRNVCVLYCMSTLHINKKAYKRSIYISQKKRRKMRKRHGQFTRQITNGLHTYEEMFNSILNKKERQIINSQGYYCSPVRLAKIFKYLILVNLVANSRCYWWKYKMIQPVWRGIWQYLTKPSTHMPFDPVITVTRIYPKEIPPQMQNNICSRLLIAILTVIAKYWKQTNCLFRRLGEFYTSTNGILRNCEKDEWFQ